MSKSKTPSEIVGHQKILEHLSAALRSQSLASAYVFAGPQHVGKYTIAHSVAQSLLCLKAVDGIFCGECQSCTAFSRGTHPDSQLISATSSLGIDTIREVIHALARKPSLSRSHVVCIEAAETLTEESSNALLKTLEEPRGVVSVILITNNLSALPMTVRSRCQILEFGLVDTASIETWLTHRVSTPEQAQFIAHVVIGRPGVAAQLLEHEDNVSQYMQRANQLSECIESTLPQRFASLQSMMPAKGEQGEQRTVAKQILYAFQLIFRDVTLYQYECQEYIAHRFLLTQLQSIAKRYSPQQVVQYMKRLDVLQGDMQRTVNPVLALEQFASTL